MIFIGQSLLQLFSYAHECFFGFFFNIIVMAVTAEAGSNIASILLIHILKSSLLVPEEDGKGSKILGGD